MPDSATKSVDLIIGRSLITAEAIAQELRERLAEELAIRWDLLTEAELLAAARDILEEIEPILAKQLQATDLAAWISGFDEVAKQTPEWVLDMLSSSGAPRPPGPPRLMIPGLGEPEEPILRFPLIDKAVESLSKKGILTREQFDQVSDAARLRAFTVSGELTEDAIAGMRDILADTIREGASLRSFADKFEQQLEDVVLPPGRLETIYRTNVQAAYRDGFEALASDPIVSDVFPYQEYHAIHDGRVREEHLQLESLGLNGTNIYRRDDPMWDYFTPPWDFNCRCGVNLLTVEAAASRGVQEAKKWLESGEPPAEPEWRLAHIPFRPPEGFTSGRTSGLVAGVV